MSDDGSCLPNSHVAKVCRSSRAELPVHRQEEKGLADVDMAWLNPSKPDGGLPDKPTYDMALTVDAVHDMARPDHVLPLVRKVSAAQPPYCRQPRTLCLSRLSGYKTVWRRHLTRSTGGHVLESLPTRAGSCVPASDKVSICIGRR